MRKMPKKEKKKSWKERQRERQIKQQRAQEAQKIQREREAKRKPRQWPKGKILAAVCLLIIIFGAYGIWQYTKTSTPSDETPPVIPTSQIIYISPDGQVSPSTAPISNVGNSHYTFTADIYNSIILGRDNIVIDGANHALQGTGVYGSRGIDLTGRSNVTITNLKIKGFDYGIYLSPVQVRRGQVRVGTRTLKGDDLSAFFIQPRNDSDIASVIVVSGSGLAGMRSAYDVTFFRSFVRYPDCMVTRVSREQDGNTENVAVGFFGLDWSVTNGEFSFKDETNQP